MSSAILSATAASASCPAPLRQVGQILSATSLSRCWSYLSSAPFCDALVSSHDSSSKSLPPKKLLASLAWHLIPALISLPTFLPTLLEHLRLSLPVGILPASSPVGSIMAPVLESMQ